MKKSMVLYSLIMLLSIGLAGCNFPGRTVPTSPVDILNTAAAQTIQAQQTSIELTRQAITPEETLSATLKPPDAGTPEPDLTPTISPVTRCDQAAFVSETIPDGSVMNPGQPFTKTWTLRNSGTCTWNANYDIVFINGASMNAPASKPLTSSTVEPGQSVVITLELVAPIATGTQRGDFKLRNSNGALFGIGERDGPFWVEINVRGSFYDFAEKYCAPGVTWSSGTGFLPCPGTPGDSKGWVLKIDEPILENGAKDNEPGLQIHPQQVYNGWIKGTYPVIHVSGNLYFKAIIGCYGESACDVKFKLNYSIDGGPEQTLATWHEVQDGIYNRVSVDLASLAGKNVQFILLVEANGSSANDEALWFAPRLTP